MVRESRQLRTERLVVGVTGPIGSGKTSAAQYLSSAHGFQYIRYSQVLAEWFASDPEGKVHLQEIGWKVMAGGMQAELNRRLIARVSPAGNIAVDGLRHPVDYQILRQTFLNSFQFLYIDSPAEERWQRLRGRGRYASREEFNHATSHPVEQQIEALRPNADVVIRNEGSLQLLYECVDAAIRDFRKEGQT